MVHECYINRKHIQEYNFSKTHLDIQNQHYTNRPKRKTIQPYTNTSEVCQSKLYSLFIGYMGWKVPFVMQAVKQKEKHYTTGTE
jgi:hypothetical protein